MSRHATDFKDNFLWVVFTIIGVIAAFQLLFTSAEHIFPNWSSIAALPPILATIMPWISLAILVLVVFSLVEMSSRGRK